MKKENYKLSGKSSVRIKIYMDNTIIAKNNPNPFPRIDRIELNTMINIGIEKAKLFARHNGM